MRVADTSYLFALFHDLDAHHRTAHELSQQPGKVMIPAEIFAETMWLIQRRIGYREACAAGDWFRRQHGMAILDGEPEVRDRIWQTYLMGGRRGSYPDAVVIGWSRHLGAEVLTFDEDLKRGLGQV